MDSLAGKFYCPHCGEQNPPFDFVYTSGGNPMLSVAYVTVVCGGTVQARTCVICRGLGKIATGGPAPVLEMCPGCRGEERTARPCRRILGVGIVACQVHKVPVLDT